MNHITLRIPDDTPAFEVSDFAKRIGCDLYRTAEREYTMRRREIEGMWWQSKRFYALMGLPYDGLVGKEGDGLFYDRMDDLAGRTFWRFDHILCAATLRAYADRYHPAEPESYPQIRAELDRIFAREVAA